AANAARTASEESQAAADRHAASLEKRLTALAATAGAKKAPLVQKREERPVERVIERTVAIEPEVQTLHAAANAAVARTSRPQVRAAAATQTAVQEQPKRMFKGFGGWGNFMPKHEEAAPVAANEQTVEDTFDLV